MVNIMYQIEQEYRKFRKEDSNHREPNSIFLSVDVFHDLIRHRDDLTMERVIRNTSDPKLWTVLGMDLCIVENKRNFIYVAIV